MSGIFVWGYYGTHYRVELCPPFVYTILYKEYYLIRFNHQKSTTQVIFQCARLRAKDENNFEEGSGTLPVSRFRV